MHVLSLTCSCAPLCSCLGLLLADIISLSAVQAVGGLQTHSEPSQNLKAFHEQRLGAVWSSSGSSASARASARAAMIQRYHDVYSGQAEDYWHANCRRISMCTHHGEDSEALQLLELHDEAMSV